MKANKANLLQFLYKSGHLELPGYQRAYNWDTNQCKQLWDNILNLVNNDTIPSHFMGSIVYIGKDINNISSINTCSIVDGGQRLITISLLLSAINSILEETNKKDEITRRKINNYYLFNSEGEGKLKYKLGLKNNDQETYVAILENREELPLNYSARIVENYNYFKTLIRQSSINPCIIFNSLHKLTMIDIILQPDIDDPLLFFNSINSTKLDLSQTDKIKNHILMKLNQEEQEDFINNYWTSMESMFLKGNNNHFDKFIHSYLLIHNTDEVISLDDLYQHFQKFLDEKLKYQQIKDILKHFYQYSKYFIKIAFAQEQDNEVRQALETINRLDCEDAYPFLLEVFDDYENKLITKEIFIEILNAAQSYILRRSIHGNTKSSDNITFSTLSHDIKKMLTSKNFNLKVVDSNPFVKATAQSPEKEMPRTQNKVFFAKKA